MPPDTVVSKEPTMTTTNLSAASNQWATRPDDQRFVSLEDLHEAVQSTRDHSRSRDLRLDHLRVEYDDGNELYLAGHNGNSVGFTHWSFGQLAKIAQAPASYLRALPAPIARINLAYGLEMSEAGKEEAKLLYSVPQEGAQAGQARAFTSTHYGRIWDVQVVEAVQHMNDDNRWSVPTPFKSADGGHFDPNFRVDKRSTTLYASDRDVFIFLVDETRPIEVEGQRYFRGFYTWNSEVGKATFGLASFLYSYVCANRIIWGATQVEELRIRHTAFAPDRFIEQARPALTAMSEASSRPIEEAIRKAKATRVGKTVADVEKWLAGKKFNGVGFGRAEIKVALNLAERADDSGSSGDPTNLWDVVQGGTAAARGITHTDDRIDTEKRWSALLGEFAQ
jgi:hypothetical protein